MRFVALRWEAMLPPMLGFACLAILLAVWSRRVMQLVGALGGIEAIRPFLLTTGFEAWHGLFADPRFTGPLTSEFTFTAHAGTGSGLPKPTTLPGQAP